MKKLLIVLAASVALNACAGRAPNPVQIAHPMTDRNMSCAAIEAELLNNQAKMNSLNADRGQKRTQNIVAGTVGAVLFFPALFLMDFQGAAKQEIQALEGRNNYLASMRQQCALRE